MNLRVRNFVRSHEQYEQILERGYRFSRNQLRASCAVEEQKRKRKTRYVTVKMDGLLSDTFYK